MNKQVTEWKGLPIKTAPVRAYGQRPPVDANRAYMLAALTLAGNARLDVRELAELVIAAFESDLIAQEAEWIWDDDLDCWVKREA